LAAVDDRGRLMASTWVRTDEEIAAWLRAAAPDPTVVAIDAPLIVPNPSGQRRAETLISRAFGRYGASAHTSNRGHALFDPPRASTLANRFGWDPDPGTAPGHGRPVCIEVYPHPAMITLFGLPERLAYKKGPDRRGEFARLVTHMQSIPELQLTRSPRWQQIVALVADPRPGDLNRVEDEVDAILCAHLAWLWHHQTNALVVYGTAQEGYIVAPPPPGETLPRPRRDGQSRSR
jgi:predicted RNase H-like nuclease